jgi:methionyl-tRNA formyltransferase
MTTRIVILTCMRRDYASRCLPVLAATDGLVVDRVILAHGGSPGRGRLRLLWRKLVKIAKIGPLGAWNGVRMRRWFEDRGAEDIAAVCARLSIPLVETPYLNCDATREAMRAAKADIGLSLGNGYIAPSVFSIPRLGMLNIHTEILPDYQGAQSVLWALYDGRTETGFTIHRIAKTIDTGILAFR